MTISAVENNRPPTSQLGPQDNGQAKDGDSDWLKRAQDAYRDSTSYVDNNYRKHWDDSIRAFNNQHPTDSKYNQPAFEKRSKLYRPKIRSIIRKNEAAAAAAFFSTTDVVSVSANDQTNKIEVASADIMKELLQYRLTKSIPWFQVVLGGLQDAQNAGVVCAHVYWDYKAQPCECVEEVEIPPMDQGEEEYPQQSMLPAGAEPVESADQLVLGLNGDPLTPPSQDEYKNYSAEEPISMKAVMEEKPLIDKPCVDLIPVENIRIDPGANWMDPINTSPYIIHIMPMYVMDVKERMESGEWRRLSDSIIKAATESKTDSTRTARNKDREDQYTPDGKSLPDYETVWVQRHIHRKEGVDFEFYTMGDLALLSDPRTLKESVFHGRRPYVMGYSILETHKIFPSTVPQLGRGLIDESNEVSNQRIDNVKFVLNKKWFAKRGRDVDVAGLIRNVPGGVVMMEDPINDVREITWPDVTQSAYEEQSRIDQDLNDLLGNFSAGQVMADKGINAPARNMAMLAQSTGTLTEYMLLTYVETFVQPVLRQIVMMEQEYETDQVLFAIAAKKIGMFQKYGIDQVTDEMLDQELTLTVNVGMGATDPQMKLQKFIAGMTTYANIVAHPTPGLNIKEVGKEIFGYLGYSDGSRFFNTDDPQVAMLQQQLQQANMLMQQMQQKLNEKMTAHQIKKEVAALSDQTKLQIATQKEDNENLRNATTHLRAIREADQSRDKEIVLQQLRQKHDRETQSPMSAGR